MPHPLSRLEGLLQAQAHNDGQELSDALMAVAHWRLACGDLEGAASWQRMALSPPDRWMLRQHLLQLQQQQIGTGAVQLPAGDESWLPLVRALLRGHYARASELQQSLIPCGPPPISQMASLLRCWLQAGWPQQALDLFDASSLNPATPGGLEDPATAAALGWALQDAGRHQQALDWWQHSYRLAPQQAGVAEVLMNGVATQ